MGESCWAGVGIARGPESGWEGLEVCDVVASGLMLTRIRGTCL